MSCPSPSCHRSARGPKPKPRADTPLTVRPKEATAFAGLAPVHRQSGSSLRGRSHIARQGGAQVRTLLYLAALSASRFDPQLREFYDRLRAAGKTHKQARIAV